MHSIIVDGLEYRFYDHLFAVSRCGKVLRKLTPYTPTKRPDGYLVLGRQRLMHRVVAMCWLTKPDHAHHVHHINGNKADNRADNLEWVSPREHFGDRHADTHGKHEVSFKTREKLRQFRLGRVTSEETKAKQRAALLGRKRPYFARKGHTEESKTRRSETHFRNMACEIEGVLYRSIAHASKSTGVKKGTIRKRCLSENFPSYRIIASKG